MQVYCVVSLFCGVVLGVNCLLSNHLAEVEKACVLCLFLTVPWVGLLSVLVAFPCHSCFLASMILASMTNKVTCLVEE